MKINQKGFAGIIVLTIVALGLLGFGTYKVFNKSEVKEEGVNIYAGSDFPEGYVPADHSAPSQDHKPVTASDDSASTSNWQTYINEKYGFEIQVPVDWKVADSGEFINIYPSNIRPNLYLTHHADVTHVSIFPRGVGTEGVSGVSQESEINYREIVKRGRSYLDKNGLVKYTHVYFSNFPSSWSASGFVWSSVGFESLTKEADREIENKMLSTFKFIGPSIKDTSNWKIYTNSELGFELSIPSYVSVDKVFNDDRNRLVIFKSDKENFEVRLKQAGSTTLDQYHYLDFLASSNATLGGKEALVFEAPKGYCDGPGCGDPFIAYSTKNNNYFYNIVFFGDVKLTDIEKPILTSFKFTE